MVITLGPHASAISLTYIPLVSPLAPKSCDHESWEERRANLPAGWETKISWETATPGMVLRPVFPQYKPPPGLRWLPRIGSNGKLYQAQGPPGSSDEKGQGQQQELPTGPMGFIKRYWYILLPLFIANFMGAEPPPQEGQSGGGQGQGGAGEGGGGAAAAAPSAASGGTTRSRRGKRG
jgi:hypothetical protein